MAQAVTSRPSRVHQTWLLLVSLVVLDMHHLTYVRRHQREAVNMLGGARLSWRVGGCWVALRWGRLRSQEYSPKYGSPSAVRVYRRYAGTSRRKSNERYMGTTYVLV